MNPTALATTTTPEESRGALDLRVVVEHAAFRLDVALSASPGEILAIMGPSGAGKSTLLSAITGLARLREGSVRIDGVDAVGLPPNRRGVVLLGQEPRLFPHMSARDNVAFGLRAHGQGRERARRAAEEWLGRVGLEGFGARRPAELSGGQQQRVALARALATSPRLLLLDEPLTSLDPETAGEIRALVAAQVRTSGVTTLIVSHDAVDAASLADRLLILENGRVTQAGLVREVLTIPATAFGAVIAGTNRLPGRADGGRWRSGGAVLAPGGPLPVAEGAPLIAFVRPAAVRIDPASSSADPGSAGTWIARIVRLEQTPAGARVHLAEPALAVDIPTEVIAEQWLDAGAEVRVTVPAAQVRFAPAAAIAE